MPLDISRIHALCIDLDGTISDTDDLYVQALLRWLAPLRSFLSQKRLGMLARWLVMSAETPGNFVMRILDRLHLNGFYHRLRAKQKGSTSILQAVQEKSAYRMIPGVREILDIVKARYPLVLVSARNQEGTIAILRHFEIEHLFDLIVTSHTTLHSKPFPDPLIFVSEQLRIPAENLVMVGDTVVDILAGKAVGAQTIGVLCGFGTRQELTRAGADFILDSTAQLPVALWQDHE